MHCNSLHWRAFQDQQLQRKRSFICTLIKIAIATNYNHEMDQTAKVNRKKNDINGSGTSDFQSLDIGRRNPIILYHTSVNFFWIYEVKSILNKLRKDIPTRKKNPNSFTRGKLCNKMTC